MPADSRAAAATAHKRTFARVYLGLEGGASSISSVTGRLTASRPDGSLPGGPTSIDSSNAITVEADRDGSIVTYDAELKLKGLLGLSDPLLGLTFNQIGDRAAAGLIDALTGERVAG